MLVAIGLLLSVGCMEIDLYLYVYHNRSFVTLGFMVIDLLLSIGFIVIDFCSCMFNGNRPFVAAVCKVIGLL